MAQKSLITDSQILLKYDFDNNQLITFDSWKLQPVNWESEIIFGFYKESIWEINGKSIEIKTDKISHAIVNLGAGHDDFIYAFNSEKKSKFF